MKKRRVQLVDRDGTLKAWVETRYLSKVIIDPRDGREYELEPTTDGWDTPVYRLRGFGETEHR